MSTAHSASGPPPAHGAFHGAPPARQSVDGAFIDPSDFQRAYGETLDSVLDLDQWQRGGDMASLYAKIEQEIQSITDLELNTRNLIRERFFPSLRTSAQRTPELGHYRIAIHELEAAHRTILFNGGVEACRGVVAAHDTIAMTVSQLGVALVSYQGDHGTWGHRLFRRDLRYDAGPLEHLAAELLQRRVTGITGNEQSEQRLSNLARRGIIAFAERSALLRQSTAPWRLGFGQPVPFELLTGGGSMNLATRSVEMLDALLNRHRRVVFVSPRHPDRGLLTLGMALYPLEYAVVDSSLTRLHSLTERANYSREERDLVDHFVAGIGPDILIGVYRASEFGKPQVFYAHADHVHEAALIAIADSVLHEHRSIPLLLDLAETVCRSVFPSGEISQVSESAWTASDGSPFATTAWSAQGGSHVDALE